MVLKVLSIAHMQRKLYYTCIGLNHCSYVLCDLQSLCS